MRIITSDTIITPALAQDAILNEQFTGFKEDYLVLHCLLKAYFPKSVFEIGTNMGVGTKIIKNAVGELAEVYSLDLPTELAHISLQHPINEGKGDSVGHLCDLPFTQLRGDSMSFDFSKYPCEAYFCDAEHTYKAVFHETTEMLKNKPTLIAYHDSDMPEVYNGIVDGFSNSPEGENYTLFRVSDTRIAFAVRKHA